MSLIKKTKQTRCKASNHTDGQVKVTAMEGKNELNAVL